MIMRHSGARRRRENFRFFYLQIRFLKGFLPGNFWVLYDIPKTEKVIVPHPPKRKKSLSHIPQNGKVIDPHRFLRFLGISTVSLRTLSYLQNLARNIGGGFSLFRFEGGGFSLLSVLIHFATFGATVTVRRKIFFKEHFVTF